jgi:hypothetical protein
VTRARFSYSENPTSSRMATSLQRMMLFYSEE